ncbi:MAG TPA: tetratricopeptide repeat protein [Candidatus Koribacter sp.]|jgi:tetratricopeptide (TPR) repeat protein
MARRKFWLFNRVVAGLIVFMIATALWEFEWKPQYRPYYEDGVRLYEKGQYQQAQGAFDRAYGISPNAVDVIVMQGWNNLKLGRFDEARYYFTRALRIDPRTEEAQIGLSFVTLETGHGEMDSAALSEILSKRKDSPDVMLLLAQAEEKQGDYFQAAQIFSHLQGNRQYGREAQEALQDIFGLKGTNDSPIQQLQPVQRPAQFDIAWRANGTSMQSRAQAGGWSDTYLEGVDLGAAAPGYRPNSLPNDVSIYSEWLKDASQLNANTLRVYTLLPPAFYRAFQHFVKGGGNLSLVQQIWVDDPSHQNLFDSGFEEATKGEIRRVVDAMHGRGLLPPSHFRGSGVYEFNIADHVSGFIIGKDLDPQVVTRTNVLNAGRRAYNGKYLSVNLATPTEVWLVEMADYLFDYETSTYNSQHPVAMVSGPAPDPSANVLLEGKIKPTEQCVAGIFAAYPAYPFYPDYMEKNSRFSKAADKSGANPVYGFVKEVRAHLSVPYVVGEYGISTTMEPRHLVASGWNQGGYSDRDQAEALVRLTRSLRDAGSAGGFVFELADEWYRQGGVNGGFTSPPDSATLSMNDLDPAKGYGLIGYRTSKSQLFSGDPAAWEKEKKIEGSGSAPQGDEKFAGEQSLKSLEVAGDEGYLYLRLQVACLDCVGTQHTGKLHFEAADYAVALKTLPGNFGIKNLPFGNVELLEGANFLLVLRGPGQSALLVADNFSPFQLAPRPDDPNRKQLVPRRGFTPGLLANGSFIAMVEEDEQEQLPYGSGDPSAADYDSRAQWYADVKHSAVLVRIPWARLLITDPSSMMSFVGFDRGGGIRTTTTTGVDVAAFALTPKGNGELKDMTVAQELPANGVPPEFTWEKWNSVKVEPFRKEAFTAISQEFARSKPTKSAGKKAEKPSAGTSQGAK